MKTSASEDPTRRRFLRCLLAVAGVAGLVVLRMRVGAGSRDRSLARLDPADRAVAALAAGFVRADPAAARRVADAVAMRISALERIRTPARRVATARVHLLDADRVEVELARGDVSQLGGWVLARSEAEFSIFAFVESRA